MLPPFYSCLHNPKRTNTRQNLSAPGGRRFKNGCAIGLFGAPFTSHNPHPPEKFSVDRAILVSFYEDDSAVPIRCSIPPLPKGTKVVWSMVTLSEAEDLCIKPESRMYVLRHARPPSPRRPGASPGLTPLRGGGGGGGGGAAELGGALAADRRPPPHDTDHAHLRLCFLCKSRKGTSRWTRASAAARPRRGPTRRAAKPAATRRRPPRGKRQRAAARRWPRRPSRKSKRPRRGRSLGHRSRRRTPPRPRRRPCTAR